MVESGQKLARALTVQLARLGLWRALTVQLGWVWQDYDYVEDLGGVRSSRMATLQHVEIETDPDFNIHTSCAENKSVGKMEVIRRSDQSETASMCVQSSTILVTTPGSGWVVVGAQTSGQV